MTLIVGPLYGGKKTYLMEALGLSFEALSHRAVWDVQELALMETDLEALADRLSEHEFVLATEIGGGVVPTDPLQRAQREAAGRLCCLLAARADRVIRVVCGLPQALKGELL